MSKDKELPLLSGIEVIKKLKKAGFIVVRQKGSHIRLEKYNFEIEKTIKLTVPNHPQIKKGTLKSIIEMAHLTVEDFNKID